LKWLKTRLGWAAEEIGATLEAELTAALVAGFAKGESIDDIAKRIEEQFGPMRAERIARTEVMQSSARGNIEGYREAGCDEAEFMTSLDDVVCETCDEMNGDIETVDDAEAILTLHPNCRCVWLPVIPEGW